MKCNFLLASTKSTDLEDALATEMEPKSNDVPENLQVETLLLEEFFTWFSDYRQKRQMTRISNYNPTMQPKILPQEYNQLKEKYPGVEKHWNQFF